MQSDGDGVPVLVPRLFLVHCCSEHLALCQEWRELKNRGFDLEIGECQIDVTCSSTQANLFWLLTVTNHACAWKGWDVSTDEALPVAPWWGKHGGDLLMKSTLRGTNWNTRQHTPNRKKKKGSSFCIAETVDLYVDSGPLSGPRLDLCLVVGSGLLAGPLNIRRWTGSGREPCRPPARRRGLPLCRHSLPASVHAAVPEKILRASDYQRRDTSSIPLCVYGAYELIKVIKKLKILHMFFILLHLFINF
jgi:hypothetical protein